MAGGYWHINNSNCDFLGAVNEKALYRIEMPSNITLDEEGNKIPLIAKPILLDIKNIMHYSDGAVYTDGDSVCKMLPALNTINDVIVYDDNEYEDRTITFTGSDDDDYLYFYFGFNEK